MTTLLHQILEKSTHINSKAIAISDNKNSWSYLQLFEQVQTIAQALVSLKLRTQQRVAIYLPKQIETVSCFFAIPQTGGVFVPLNPVLKAPQVEHVLKDCNVKILITSKSRLQSLAPIINDCPDLQTIILIENEFSETKNNIRVKVLRWQEFLDKADNQSFPNIIDTHMAAILYTSGSTGKPKGVILSHRNIVEGAESVTEYLGITENDRILAVLPFSFDYGLSQLTCAILKGAQCVILDYLLPRDVTRALEKHKITGLAAVPPLWAKLAQLEWSQNINLHLRFMTNSGGKMPKTILDSIRKKAPASQFFLMYGLTEAFRSTYLPPDQIDIRPDSMGKAIPNSEVLVVREDGSTCIPHEPGELVHRGSLVALGYWNDPVNTAERFKPAPVQLQGLPIQEIAVWSGDTVYMDEEGYLYFVGRKDDMIKTSGYRVSQTEIEEVIYTSGLVKEAAALGIEHEIQGQAILLIISVETEKNYNQQTILNLCKNKLPNYMVPTKIEVLSNLPKNPNGKIDRTLLAKQFAEIFK